MEFLRANVEKKIMFACENLVSRSSGEIFPPLFSINLSSSVAFDQVNKLPELQSEIGQGVGGGSLTNPEGTYVDQYLSMSITTKRGLISVHVTPDVNLLVTKSHV